MSFFLGGIGEGGCLPLMEYNARLYIRPPGEMASRLTTNQEIAGSTPAVVIFSFFDGIIGILVIELLSALGL